MQSKHRTLPPPPAWPISSKNTNTSPATAQKPIESALVPSPASLAPTVILGNPTRLLAPPKVTLGVPTQQRPPPQVTLGLPESILSGKTLTRLVSEQPALAEMATQIETLPAPPPDKRASPLPTIPPEGLDATNGDPRSQPPINPFDALPPSLFESVPQSSHSLDAARSLDTVAPTGNASSSAGDASGPNNRFPNAATADREKKEHGPYFFGVAGEEQAPCVDAQAWQTPYTSSVFSPQPILPIDSDPRLEASSYRGKFDVPTQRPWVELWRPFYTGGIYPPAKEWFGRYNLAMPDFIVYGDFRTGVGVNRNANGNADNWAGRLNLDMDLKLTSTERLHAFMGPLDRNGDYTRLDFTHGLDFVDRTDLRFDNLYFEGDAGAIWGGLTDQSTPFDLPFSFGFLPLFYQNGIWANDNVIGAALALPSKNSPLLKWSNYDATFFWASDQVNTDAFAGDLNAAEFFGSAWFIEAYDGYIEADYAFVHDDVGGHRSYNNASVAYTRRYLMRVSNSIRYITNFGQSLPSDQRTADGHMILLENSLISSAPNTLVPYLNFFYGQGRTQSLARANAAGGILNNTGINFETDGLTGYPTLDATGVNSSGAALGINILGADFQHQLILEVAALSANGQAQFRNAPGDEYAVGMRYQKPLNNAWIFRTDNMIGWRENAKDLRGTRVEFRWKF
ncbi:MAG: hypothetical protein ABI557_00085 [Aureliella sp.]